MTRERSLINYRFGIQLFFLVSFLIVFVFVAVRLTYQIELTSQESVLTAQLYRVEEIVDRHLDVDYRNELNYMVERVFVETGTHFVLVSREGQVIADSAHMNDGQESFKALSIGKRIVFDPRWQGSALTVTHALEYRGVPYFIRASYPVSKLWRAVVTAVTPLILLVAAGIVLIFLIDFFNMRWIRRQLMALVSGSEAAGSGQRPACERSDILEFRAIQQMIVSLSQQIQTGSRLVTDDELEKNAIFSALIEGVFIVEKDLKISSANRAAHLFLNSPAQTLVGKSVFECVWQSEMLTLIQETLKRNQLTHQIIQVSRSQTRWIQFYGVPFKKSGDTESGLFVLHDVTQLKELEGVRQEFVANVSHELKTPLTMIRGFIETLRMDSDMPEKDRVQFLTIVDNHAARMQAIVDDMLLLAKLEHREQERGMSVTAVSLPTLIDEAISIVAPLAEAKGIVLERVAIVDALIEVNAALIVQALVNLLDNAIKYSPEKSCVKLGVSRLDASHIEIVVSDQGFGIPKSRLPNLFDRFFRVDTARSRDVGGTGLGLSIVKHIMDVHGGYVRVESKLNSGSRFFLGLPEKIQNNEVMA